MEGWCMDDIGDRQNRDSRTWTIEESEQLYNLHGWGEPYFSINAAGHVTVSPKGDRGGSLDLFNLVEALKQRHLDLPLIIRFPDILEDRIERLNACFARAIAHYTYSGSYQGVFPIKCNQQRHLVEDVVHFGASHQLGLEVGSKPELMIALAILDTPGSLLICNGYKDEQYIETALLAQRLGHRPIIVLAQPSELHLVLKVSRQLNIRPLLGVRAKLSVKGHGRWAATTSDTPYGVALHHRAKFGLTIPEIMAAVDTLRSHQALECLQLLHFHIGSQISSISLLKEALREASQIYVELVHLGGNMQFLDVGGGLAVDYDGSKTDGPASKNYNMQHYANDVVAAVKNACDAGNVNVPTLISESGRAIASHQSILLFDVLGSSDIDASVIPSSADLLPQADASSRLVPLVLRNIRDTYESISPQNYQEAYHDVIQFKEEALSLFKLGYLTMADRATVEQIYWAACHRILHIARQDAHQTPDHQSYLSDDIMELDSVMASIYYINISVFRSVPDSWAIGQLFPIMPIHRLNESPACRAILADLTCDNDGKISRFPYKNGGKSLLNLHPLEAGQSYYLGLFLGGTYQEIMGNHHNLFGDTHVVQISLTSKGYNVEHVVKGNTISEVLKTVNYDTDTLLDALRHRTEKALQNEQITREDAHLLCQTYGRSLQHYTYLDYSQSQKFVEFLLS